MARSALSTFVGVYLDEDLFEEYQDEFKALDAFVVERPEAAAALPDEISSVLAAHSDDNEIGALLDQLGMGIHTNGLTYREWLTQIADRVRAATT